jgi:undecaprenyl-diphosphatase
MTLILLIHAIVLGIVEGLTEFLPVSSTGHLILVGDAIGFQGERANTFEIFIQLGAILSVVWFYREKFWTIARGLDRRSEQRFVLNLLIAFLPAATIGFFTHQYIKAWLFSPLIVAVALIVGGIFMIAIERWHEHRGARVHSLGELDSVDAFKVGVAQCFALVPGVSRAGATIMGGLLAGLGRTTATEFSFFLAVPTMFAATVYDLWKSRAALSTDDVGIFTVGFVVSFIVALIVIRTFLVYVGRHNFRPFAWYRISFGLLALAYFWP